MARAAAGPEPDTTSAFQAQCLVQRGLCCLALGRVGDALTSLQQAKRLQPDDVRCLHACGVALARVGQAQAALQHYDAALQGAPDDVSTLADRAVVLSQLGRLPEALHSAQRARQCAPQHAPAWNNEAAVQLQLRQPAQALEAAAQALRWAPGDPAAAANRVRALQLAGQLDDALSEADALARRLPGSVSAWQLALGLNLQARRWVAAEQAGECLLHLAPATPFVAGRWLHARGKLCRWDGWAAQRQQHQQAVAEGQPVAMPFGFMALVDDAALQCQAGGLWVRHALGAVPPGTVHRPGAAGQRRAGPWRIGWFSADFYAHPTARLLAGLFEAQDQQAHEHHALSITPVLPDDPLQQRLRRALPRWHELHALGDEPAAQAIAALELDVLVDLGGLTRGARLGVLARRPAPLQVGYLGFIGSTGAQPPWAVLDALVADDCSVPSAHAPFFSEAVWRLPGGFWPREATVPESPAAVPAVPADDPARAAARQAHGLPASGFVYANFCDAAKLNPPVFDVWMRVLQAMPGSVLWLLRGPDEMVVNLQREALARGVAPQRLVFAQRLPWRQHLARHALADLFLDTWPFNGHTTVADALLAGLPVLSLQGQAMAARVAASQLQTLDLTDLVCSDAARYQALAIELALQPQRLAAARERLRVSARQQTGPSAVRRHSDELLALLTKPSRNG